MSETCTFCGNKICGCCCENGKFGDGHECRKQTAPPACECRYPNSCETCWPSVSQAQIDTAVAKPAPLEPREFKQIVGQAIGRASVCWDELPTGVFDSTTASSLVDDIVAAYDAIVKRCELLQKCADLYDVRTAERNDARIERDSALAAVRHLRAAATSLLDDIIEVHTRRGLEALEHALACTSGFEEEK